MPTKTIRIERPSDGQAVAIPVTEQVPGLGYSRQGKRQWAVFHLPSGLHVCGWPTSREHCKRIISQLAKLGDWNRPQAELDWQTLLSPASKFLRRYQADKAATILTPADVPAGHTFNHEYCHVCGKPIFLPPGGRQRTIHETYRGTRIARLACELHGALEPAK